MLVKSKPSTVGGRIQQARLAREVSQSALAKALKLSRGAIGQWEAGITEPTSGNLRRVAVFLRVDSEWLSTNRGQPPSADAEAPGGAHTDRPIEGGIRELDARAGMGGGGVIESETRSDGTHADPLKPDTWIFPQAYMREVLHAPAGRLLVLEAQGDSMSPTISSGERVVIDTGHRLPSPDGVYAMRDRFDLIVIKRLQIRQDTPKIRVISDNPAHPAEEVGLDEVTVVGRVVCCLRRI